MKKSTTLVRNTTETSKQFSRLTFNLLPKQCRLDTLEGREHCVVPMVMLTEGVHEGSNGPLLYPAEELSKTPQSWNLKPIVVYHPTMNGEGISACDPVVINNRKVGVILNTRFEGGRLKAEAWLEKPRSDTVDSRIMKAVESAEMMELSTGVFVDMEKGDGEWNGESYVGIARNYRPDHLALLPDQIGACSIADGAGFIRNQSAGEKLFGGVRSLLRKLGIVANELSHSHIAGQLYTALNKRFNPSDSSGDFCYVEDVFSDFVIYFHKNRFWRLSYTSSDTGVTLSDEAPVEVVRTTQYRTVVANSSPEQTPGQGQTETNNMNKKQTVDAIITANTGWQEKDRDALMALNEGQLTLIQNMQKPAATPPATAPAASAAVPPVVPAPVTTNSQPAPVVNKVVTIDEYIAAAPKEVQEVLRNGMTSYSEEKTRLVDALVKNTSNTFTKEDLEKRSLNDLRGMVRLAGGSAPATNTLTANYSGQAPIVATLGTEAEPVLELPVINFAAASK